LLENLQLKLVLKIIENVTDSYLAEASNKGGVGKKAIFYVSISRSNKG